MKSAAGLSVRAQRKGCVRMSGVGAGVDEIDLSDFLSDIKFTAQTYRLLYRKGRLSCEKKMPQHRRHIRHIELGENCDFMI